MTQEHPITPPPELLNQWAVDAWGDSDEVIGHSEKEIATQAARWGADMELEACCKALEDIWDQEDVVTLNDFLRGLRSARRPKPLSLKEQALEALKHAEEGWRPVPADCAIIRRALESLPS